jgi:putative oxidoreductase
MTKQTGARSTSSTGAAPAAFILRAALGPTFMYHGINKINGPGGLDGTTKWFASIGFKPAAVHARLAAATEISSGLAMALGLASPLPAGAIVGLMAVAARTDHRGKGFFVFKGGWEYTAFVSAAALAQAALGAGPLSLDAALGRQRRGARWALTAAVMGASGAAALLWSSYRPDDQ